MICLLFFGAYHYSGSKYFVLIAILLLSFIATYLFLHITLFNNFKAIIDNIHFSSKNAKSLFYILIIFSISFPFIHLYLLGSFPFFTSWTIFDYKKIFFIRNDIVTQSSSITNYLSSFVVKSFLPIVIFFSLKNKFKIIHIVLVLVGSFYCLNLMQKGYILLVLAPVILYSILNLQLKQLAVYLTIAIGIITLQVYASNPELRTQNKAQIVYGTESQQIASEVVEPGRSTLYYVALGLVKRVCYIPGKIVCEWFNYIPSKLPFQNGDGYLFLCRINNHNYIDYSMVLYDIVYPEYAKAGIHGTVNGAFFIYDYANFGKMGLLFSGFAIAFLLFIISIIHTINPIQSASLISYYIFMLSSSALSTLLYSGGLGFILVFLILFNRLEK
jgi:hypothetical protein